MPTIRTAYGTTASERRALLALAIGTLCACGPAVRTPYVRPDVTLPVAWQATAPDGAVTVDAWWRRFDDAALDAAIDAVLARNNDLAAATIRVRRAQLQADLARNQFVPAVSAGVNSGISRSLDHGGPSSRSNSASLSVSYEVDLWGRLGSERDAAVWEALATEQDREATAIALVGTTARLYWELAYLNQRLAASRMSIEVARRTLDFVRVQYRAGAVSALEVSDAEQNLASQEASDASLQQQRIETRNAWAILFDGPPGEIGVDPQDLPDGELPAIDAGLPADLLARRPDLRAAELRLRASLANADATRASYYPRLTLTGSAGGSSVSLGDVLANPVGSLGAGLALPFLQFNQMRLSTQVSESQYAEAVVGFRQTLYQALADVDNALAARLTQAERARLLEASLVAALKSERLYEVRYKAGAVALRAWLDAQERRRAAEIALAENRLARLDNQVSIYQALGGDATIAERLAGEG
ncbi:MAG: RND transporter [Rhodanobacter denitrificans]|uniref:RND transporter n=1 Tax=Rhodanobacter denitrificans TaxID=666685 RepID=A0A2W5LW23_9GAMM|nr:MAG: RND transporter [Rhodanobacter denitrificans]